MKKPLLLLATLFLAVGLWAEAPTLGYTPTLELAYGRQGEVTLPLKNLGEGATLWLRSPSGKDLALVPVNSGVNRWTATPDELGLWDLVVKPREGSPWVAPQVVRVVPGSLAGVSSEVHPGTVVIRAASGTVSPEVRVWLKSAASRPLGGEPVAGGLGGVVPGGLDTGTYRLTLSSPADPAGVVAGTLVVAPAPLSAPASASEPAPVAERTALRDIRALYLSSWPGEIDRFHDLAAQLTPAERAGLAKAWHKEPWGAAFGNLVTPLLPLGSIYLDDAAGAWWSGGLQVGGLAGFTTLAMLYSGNSNPGPVFGLGILASVGAFLTGKVLGVVSPFLYTDDYNRTLQSSLQGTSP